MLVELWSWLTSPVLWVLMALVALYKALFLVLRRKPQWEWKGKVVIVTGASSGIGREIALHLASKGAQCALLDLLEVVLECEKAGKSAGCKAIGILTDVAKADDCKALVDKTAAHFGQIDCLVLNAGLSMNMLAKDLPDLSITHRLMDVNFWGCVQVCHYALHHLLARPTSRVMVMSSISGLGGVPFRTGYSASKFALHGYFEALRLECEDEEKMGVTVVCPSWVKTNINASRLGSKEVAEIDNGMSAEECARLSVAALERCERFFIPQSGSRFFPYLRLLLPDLCDMIVKRKTHLRSNVNKED